MGEMEGSDIAELAVSYAALILHDEGLAIDVDKLNALCDASGVSVPSYWPKLFAKTLSQKSKDEVDSIIFSGGGAAQVAAGPGGAAGGDAGADVAEPAVEEEEEESDGDLMGGLDLFG